MSKLSKIINARIGADWTKQLLWLWYERVFLSNSCPFAHEMYSIIYNYYPRFCLINEKNMQHASLGIIKSSDIIVLTFESFIPLIKNLKKIKLCMRFLVLWILSSCIYSSLIHKHVIVSFLTPRLQKVTVLSLML